MSPAFLHLAFTVRRLMNQQEGQDLIEYALLAFLIACGAAASIGTVAAGITPAFAGIAEKFSTAVFGGAS
ncbi:MAG: Flp family type IVb pilin [Terracidiphilus sp.]